MYSFKIKKKINKFVLYSYLIIIAAIFKITENPDSLSHINKKLTVLLEKRL